MEPRCEFEAGMEGKMNALPFYLWWKRSYDIDCYIYLYERLSSYNEGQAFKKNIYYKTINYYFNIQNTGL